MSQIIFNNFKKRFLTGDVQQKFNIQLIPVNTNFDKVSENEDFIKLRTMSDLEKFDSKVTYDKTKSYPYIGEEYSLSGKKITIKYEKTVEVADTDDEINRPDYITEYNFEAFCSTNSLTKVQQEHLRNTFIELSDIDEECFKLASRDKGFYYIKTIKQFLWVINRANVNSSINIVLGDDLDSVSDIQISSIGSYDKPYKGIFDGMCHIISGITICANRSS